MHYTKQQIAGMTFIHTVLILVIMFSVLSIQNGQEAIASPNEEVMNVQEKIKLYAENPVDVSKIDTKENPTELEVAEESRSTWGQAIYNSWTDEEKEMMVRISRCEAGNQSEDTKLMIILVVVNRVASKSFPDSIHDVIYEEHSGTYQFSPLIPGGSWYNVQLEDEDYNVLDMFCALDNDPSEGALYFESCLEEDNWHSRNLVYLFQMDDMRFYKE